MHSGLTRRSFGAALAGCVIPLSVPIGRALGSVDPLVELRSYPGSTPSQTARLAGILRSFGISAEPIQWHSEPALRVAFPTLEARAYAWTQVNADTRWHALRTELGPAAAYHFQLIESPKDF